MGQNLAVYIDGGSRGNPGPSGGGFAIYKGGKVLHKGSQFFGTITNNQAEYMALRLALNTVYQKFSDDNTEVNCFMDSKLVVEQMNGNWKVKSVNVKPLFQEARKIADQFKGFTITHVPREENGLADMLANQAMDRG
jgi:ribonuclease HI